MTRVAADTQLSLFCEPAATADFEVRESRRARRLSIRVFPHGRVEIVVPPRTRAEDVARFVSSNRAWIDRTLDSMEVVGAAAELGLPDSVHFRAVDERWSVGHSVASRIRLCARSGPAGGHLELRAPHRDDPAARRRLRSWVVDQGRRLLLPRLGELAARHDFEYRRAGIGRQKTRWGSCSGAGSIRLNCSLLFLPARLADYVMLHELCHLRVLNHSRRFWSLLDGLQPGARRLDREMNDAWAQVPGWLFYGD